MVDVFGLIPNIIHFTTLVLTYLYNVRIKAQTFFSNNTKKPEIVWMERFFDRMALQKKINTS